MNSYDSHNIFEMNILVFGAGPLGCLLAARLSHNGSKVTILARGERLKIIRQDGLILEDMISGQRTTTFPPVVETLETQAFYDLIIAVLGKQHYSSALPALAQNSHAPVLFLGNNVAGPDQQITALGAGRVLLGFLDASGVQEGPVVRYAAEIGSHKAQVTFGEADDRWTARLAQIVTIMQNAGFQAEICEQMDGLLKTHAAGILPLAAAYYASGSDIHCLAGDRARVSQLVTAIGEGLKVLQVLQIPIVPARQKIWPWIPRAILARLGQRVFLNPAMLYALAHADAARPEMKILRDEFGELICKSSVSAPALERLLMQI